MKHTTSHVFRPDELPTVDRGNGARTTPLVTTDRDATSFLNGITEFEPGAKIGHHQHNVAESVMVIKGNAVVDIDGERHELRTYDTTLVPANTPHHFENLSDEPMAIFWTYGSLDSNRTLLASGQTGRIDAEQSSGGASQIVRENAVFTVKAGHEEQFVEAVQKAVPLFQNAEGARTLQLERTVEDPQKYVLAICWDSVEDHMVGFRESEAYQQWRALIGEHIEDQTVVTHTGVVMVGF